MFAMSRYAFVYLFLLVSLTHCKAKFHSVNKAGTESGAGDNATESDINGLGDQAENADKQADAAAKEIVFTANGTANTLSIDPGTTVTLAWSTKGYDSCKVEPLSLNGLTGTHDLGAVSTAQSYTITCDEGGTTDKKTVAIKMKIAPTDPTADLKVNGQDGPITVNYGSNVTVTWTSENATTCVLNPGNETGTSGNKTFTNLTASVIYILSCTAASGTTQDSVSVNVNTPPAPSGQFFVNGSGGPVYVNSGSSVDVAWSVQNATTCTVTPGNFTGVSGTKVVPNVTQSVKYALYCEGPGGTLAVDIMVYVNNTVVGSLDLKVNGADGAVNIPYDSDVNVTWTSDQASTCEVTFPGKKFNTLTGSTTVTKVRSNQYFLMVCTYAGGIPQYDYVTVTVESAPAPSVSLKANGTDNVLVVLPGENIELAWNSQHADTCTVTPGNFTGLNSTQTVTNITQTTTFTATCSGAGGTAVDAIAVHVNTVVQPPKPVPTADLKVNGLDGPVEVAKGATVTATWSSANATQCSLSPSNATGTSGSKTITNVQKQMLFVLTCVGAGGAMTDFVTVRTATGNTDPTTPKPTADLKVNGSDGPVKAYKGENINLQWWSTNATSCIINPGFYTGLTGSQAHNSIQQTTTFVLHCSGAGGDFFDQVTVNVDNGTMAPLVDLKANNSDGPLDILLGETVSLQWTTQFATDCTLLQTGNSGITGNINLGAPQQSILYTLVCRGTGGVTFDSVAVNVHKPAITQLSCSIYIHRNQNHACGPNRYEYWYLWVQAVPPALQNGVAPAKAWVNDTKLKGVYGLKENKCNNNQPVPLPPTYTYQGYTYKLWTNGVAGSSDCKVFITTFSPLVLSFTTDRIELSAPNDGPLFDLNGEGRSHYSWPTNGTKYMFLVHDKDGNRKIDSIEEMFGNKTTGPDGLQAANGFETLKKFDANRDGQITAADPIYQRLQLWGDENANGISESGELFSLQSKSIRSINLKYKQGQTRLDQYGNESKESSTFDLLSGRTLPIIDYWFVPGQQE